MLTGMFKSFEELEESLSVEELQELATAAYDMEYRKMRFAASLKGIDLDKETKQQNGSSFDQIRLKAEAKLAGKDEETHLFNTLGISVTKE